MLRLIQHPILQDSQAKDVRGATKGDTDGARVSGASRQELIERLTRNATQVGKGPLEEVSRSGAKVTGVQAKLPG